MSANYKKLERNVSHGFDFPNGKSKKTNGFVRI